MPGIRRGQPITDDEDAFGRQVVEQAIRDGKLKRADARNAQRLKAGAIEGFRHLQQKRSAMMACGAGSAGNRGQFAYGAFESQFKPELEHAVGSFGIGALLLSFFFAGLRAWLLNTLLGWAWKGLLPLFTAQESPTQPDKAWRPGADLI